MSMEYMMAKLLKGVEATNVGVTEVKNDLSSINQLVDSHSIAIKQLEQQMSQLSAAFNQRKVGTLPSDTVQNPRNDGSCMSITIRSGKILENPSKDKQVVDNTEENVIDADYDDSVDAEENVHDFTPRRHQPEKVDNQKQDKKEVVEKMIPLPPPPFPQRLKKKADDTRFSKFMTMLKQLTINVPLAEVLEQMSRYAKFMRDLLKKKRAVSYELADNVHHCSAITIRSLLQKKADPDNVYYEGEKELSVEKQLTVEPLSDVLLNFEREEAEEYEETICALIGIRSYSHAPKKLDLDLKNQSSPTAKTSIEKPPVLESKDLPSHLRDASLGSRNTLSVSVAADLGEQHVEALIFALRTYKRAIGWTIDDIIGIPLWIWIHKSHLKEDCMPTKDNSGDDDSDDDSDTGGMTPDIEEEFD
ncbi:hypothetical protein CQW23_19385 [Capsicum baccatum]|uniref:Uncharacterized protein n=1 Tax=Capsicum baccatum TaxID=33114 RepID=A0A2G2W5M2_CAPBA|nr:hypothetical protein CQW23_19385 [Capsicum baccatum]